MPAFRVSVELGQPVHDPYYTHTHRKEPHSLSFRHCQTHGKTVLAGNFAGENFTKWCCHHPQSITRGGGTLILCQPTFDTNTIQTSASPHSTLIPYKPLPAHIHPHSHHHQPHTITNNHHQPHTITSPTTYYHHQPHTITNHYTITNDIPSPTIIPSPTTHHHQLHTITNHTPSPTTHHHQSHTITNHTPSPTTHHHQPHTITNHTLPSCPTSNITPILMSQPHCTMHLTD